MSRRVRGCEATLARAERGTGSLTPATRDATAEGRAIITGCPRAAPLLAAVLASVLRTIGFDRCYVRASGAHLWDQHGTRHLDLTAGYGVFNVGRNNPDIARALTDFPAQEYPSLVQLDAPLLSGVLFIIGPLAWIDALWPLLVSAAAGAPLFAIWLLYRFRALLFRGTAWRSSPRAR